jgi:hypothetical protein
MLRLSLNTAKLVRQMLRNIQAPGSVFNNSQCYTSSTLPFTTAPASRCFCARMSASTEEQKIRAVDIVQAIPPSDSEDEHKPSHYSGEQGGLVAFGIGCTSVICSFYRWYGPLTLGLRSIAYPQLVVQLQRCFNQSFPGYQGQESHDQFSHVVV